MLQRFRNERRETWKRVISGEEEVGERWFEFMGKFKEAEELHRRTSS